MNRRRLLRILFASPFLFLCKSGWPAQNAPQRERTEMELFIFARFHARPGKENALRETLLEVHAPTRQDAGCLSHDVYHSVGTRNFFTFIRAGRMKQPSTLTWNCRIQFASSSKSNH